MVTIIELRLDNFPWAMEISGKTYDELLDIWNDAEKNGYVPTVECPSS